MNVTGDSRFSMSVGTWEVFKIVNVLFFGYGVTCVNVSNNTYGNKKDFYSKIMLSVI